MIRSLASKVNYSSTITFSEFATLQDMYKINEKPNRQAPDKSITQYTFILIPILIIILIMLPGREEAVLAVFCSIGMTIFRVIFQKPYSTVRIKLLFMTCIKWKYRILYFGSSNVITAYKNLFSHCFKQ